MSGKSKNKKIKATTSKRRLTASAQARISTKKTKKSQDLEGSYIMQGHSVSMNAMNVDNVLTMSSDQIMISYLQRMEQSNIEIMKGVDQLEQKPLAHNPKLGTKVRASLPLHLKRTSLVYNSK